MCAQMRPSRASRLVAKVRRQGATPRCDAKVRRPGATPRCDAKVRRRSSISSAGLGMMKPNRRRNRDQTTHTALNSKLKQLN